jgi:branched-chain amino acid aminotransferase
MSTWSQSFTFLDGEWFEGNKPIIGPRTHAFWLGSSVFDGARAFEGVTPDLDQHCARLNRSAKAMWLKPTMTEEAIYELALEGVKKFSKDAALYIRPMYWAERNGATSVPPDPESTRFCLCIYEAPLPKPTGIAITRSPFRKPTAETMPINAKAGCLYPNNARALIEARSRGFDNCLMCDMLGNVAELGTANIFMAKDGVVFTPAANGTFLSGITRGRVIALLREAGVTVVEAVLRYSDFQSADEIFSTGNFTKVSPVTRIDDRSLQPGPFYRRARELYWEFAHAGP